MQVWDQYPCTRTLEWPEQPLHLVGCRISTFLKSVDVGDYVLQGDLEAYSCERWKEKRQSEDTVEVLLGMLNVAVMLLHPCSL